MDFDTLVNDVLRREGGAKMTNHKADKGKLTKFGISQRANPDVDVANLDEDGAKRLYRERYWDALGADSLPEGVRALAFDTAVHHGVGRAKQWVQETGGDAAALLARREAALREQAKEPGQEVFLNGWMNRLDEFRNGAPVAEAPTQVDPLAQAGARPAIPDIPGLADAAFARTASQVRGGAADSQITPMFNEAVAQREVEENTGIVEATAQAWEDPRVNALKSVLLHAQKPDRDAEFSYYDAPDRTKWEGQANTPEELQFLRENATSVAGAQWALDQIAERRVMDKTYGNAGAGASFAGQLAVGVADPVALVIALGTAGVGRLGPIAGAVARLGRAGKAAAYVGENVAGNVLWEAVQDGLGEVKTFEDYAASAAIGAAFSAPFLPSVIRERSGSVDAELESIIDSMTIASAQSRVDGKAAGMTPDQVAAKQIDVVNEVTAPSRVAASDDGDAIVPADVVAAQRLADEAPTAEPARKTPAEAPKAPEAPTAPAAVENATTAPAEPLALPRELAGAKPKYRNAAVEFESDLEKALYIVAAPNKKSKADAKYMEWLREQFPGVSDGDIRAEGALVRAAVAELDDGSGKISLKSSFDAPASKAPAEKPATKGEKLTLREAMTGSLKSAAAQMPAVRMMTERLLGLIPAEVLDRKMVTLGDRMPGIYRGATRELEAPATGGKPETMNTTSMGNEAAILAHEAVHAATVHVIKAVRDNAKGVTMAQKQAVERLEELRKELIAELQKRGIPEQDAGARYATKNVEEFVAQVFSDTETRKVLAEMPGRGYTADSGLERFYRIVMAMLGYKPRDIPMDTALYDAMKMTETLIRTQGDIPTNAGVFFAPTPQQRAITDLKFADRMYDHARDWASRYGVDKQRLEVMFQQLTRKGSMLRDYMVSDGLKMAASKNPIVQMMSGLLVETTTGAAGRRNTASIHKHMLQQRIVGPAVNVYHTAYADFRKRQPGGGHVDDMLDGKVKRQFDKAVYEEIIKRRYGLDNPAQTDGAVRAAADTLEKLYQRSLDVQKEASTLGSGLLPADSRGYVPQQLNADQLAASSPKELEELAGHLTDHWIAAYGWSRDFSKEFSRLYLQRARQRATGASGGVDFVALESPSSAVRDTLEQMRLESRDLDSRARAELDRVGAMPQNKKRLDVDLLAVLPSGKRVMDFYNTDVERLTRGHANVVAGHAALASKGILGQRGVNNLLRAIDNAPPDELASPDEIAALQRAFSEFLGVPFKGERRSETMTNISALVRLQRMGGQAFTQLAESWNMTHMLGLGTALKALGDLPRQYMEVRTLANGGKVNNPWLTPIEQHQGFEFGLEGFRMVARLDAPDELLREYGKGSSVLTRLLQSGNYLQAQFSFFRGLNAAQHRGTAEHILKRAIGYIQEGKLETTQALQDMGISKQLATAIRADLPLALIKDAEGRVIGFDITKLTTVKAQEELLQAIHRGTAQIIQNSFIGERGAWAHDDMAKMILQLRTFGVTAMEKQWARTRMVNSNGPLNGYGYAAGVLVGQMAFASMIYAARAQVYSAGREDREDFLDKAFTPASLLQASLNYSAMSGLSGDAVDLLASTAGGWNDDLKETMGTRSFATGIGGLIPAAGSFDAGMRIMQGKGDLHTALKQLPGSNLPMIAPILNLAKED